MSRIKLLPETLASQVAAGEVVERPASVVKELVENSIDAGARAIEVGIQRGGMSRIRVVDDGCGMDRDDALLSLERHATSKIASAADLAAISTLGFRGEALPSIASVSRLRLSTREPGAVAGTEILVNGGRIETVRDGGEAPGTQIEVRSLFYNVPARRKFLRSETTEARNIEHQFFLQALAHPEIGFTLVREDNIASQLPITTSLRDRIRDLYGAKLLDDLLEISLRDRRGIQVHGWIGRAGVSRQTRAQQFVFVNGRAIDSGILSTALREGYHTALMRGQFPVTFLFVDLDPREVDVNVHPAKREVRFRDPASVREAIVEAVQRTLESGRVEWQRKFNAPAAPAAGLPPGPAATRPDGGTTSVSSQIVGRDTARPSNFAPLDQASRADSLNLPRPIDGNRPEPQIEPRRDQQFQIIGVLNRLYVLMENSDGLVLVDQHAAHERILFEELRRRMEEQGVPSQRMLLPQIFSLPPRDAEWVERNVATLQKMGIGVENFGANSFRVDTLPAFLEIADAAGFLRKVIDELITTSRSSSPLRLGEDMIAKTVCRHAVKANDPLRYPEIEKLIRDLLACDLPYCCPHGRPTMIQISHAELEKKFGRKV
ncbi:MAG TPA: DNA mismatch repair endonuclease MutL [Chthoniobacterales bacterium]|jgi:DNA mismatch repair protein MutL|nr:DNA mismatch repair endonuclease MutL [Chthoniobacterales bacterium]